MHTLACRACTGVLETVEQSGSNLIRLSCNPGIIRDVILILLIQISNLS